MKRISGVCRLVVAVAAILSSVPAICQTEADALRGLTIAACSVAYEELKWRSFDGDFENVLTWSRLQSP